MVKLGKMPGGLQVVHRLLECRALAKLYKKDRQNQSSVPELAKSGRNTVRQARKRTRQMSP